MLHHPNVNIKIEHLQRLSRGELRILWEREFVEKPPPSLGRDILALGIAYAQDISNSTTPMSAACSGSVTLRRTSLRLSWKVASPAP
jgi:hypothetical protein